MDLRHFTHWIAAVSLATVLAASCSQPTREAPREARSTAAPVPSPEVTARLAGRLADLQLMLTGRQLAADEARRLAGAMTAGQRQPRAFIDALLADSRFLYDVLPVLVLRGWTVMPSRFVPLVPYMLSATPPDSDGVQVYYLRKPCGRARARKVAPWWAPQSTVLVCPDAVQERNFLVPAAKSATGKPIHCDAAMATPLFEKVPHCGCGPHLMRCARDEAHVEEIRASQTAELSKTVGYIAEHDLPISTLWTAKETFRDAGAEFIYRRWRMELGHDVAIDDLASWPREGRWAPRHEEAAGQHAGILTTPRFAFNTGDRRLYMNFAFNFLWCTTIGAIGATPEQVLSLHATDLQGDVNEGWEALARRPLCTSCHARLDYGYQFMTGFPHSVAIGTHFMPDRNRPDRRGVLYGRDIDDPRGEAPLTPAGFAGLAVAQPEFGTCAAQTITDYMLGNEAAPADRTAVAAAYAQTPTFKSLVRQAALRYLEHPDTAIAARSTRRSSEGVASAGQPRDQAVAISAELRAQMEAHCMHCHEPGALDMAGQNLPRWVVGKMLDQVALRMMPKTGPDASRHGGGMSEPERRAMMELFMAALWPDAESRAVARSHFVGQLKALTAQHVDTSLAAVHAGAGVASSIEWRLAERVTTYEMTQMTPSYAATISLDALRACEAAGEEIAACVDRVLRPENLLKGLHRPRAQPSTGRPAADRSAPR